MAREDISDITGIEGTVRVTCDAPACRNETAGRPQLGTWFDGWAQDTRQTPLTQRQGLTVSLRALAEDVPRSHPHTAELVVEVVVTSLNDDLAELPGYAEAGVKAVWIVDCGSSTCPPDLFVSSSSPTAAATSTNRPCAPRTCS